MTEKRRIVTNTLANGTAQFTSLLAGLVFMPLLIRSFGLADYGLYLLASSIVGYASLLDFGVGASLVKMIAAKESEGSREGIGALASAALVFYIIIGVVIAALMVILGLLSGVLFRVTPEQADLLQRLLLVAAAFSLWTWPASTFVSVLHGFQNYTITARVSLGVTLANAVAIAAVLIAHQGPFVLLIATSSIGALGSLVNVFFARRQLAGITVSPTLARPESLKRIFSFSWAIFVVQVMTIVLYQQTDRMILGAFVGAAAVTLYEASGRMQGLIAALTGFANSAVIPMASHLDALGETERLRALFLRGTKYTLALVTPVIVVLAVIARPLLREWLGPDFAAQAMNARLLILPHLLVVGGIIGDSIILGTGALPQRLPMALTMAFGNLALSIALVGPLGILGVVLGTAIPYVLDYPIHMRLLLREIDVPAKRWLRETMLPVYPLLVVPASISLLGLSTPLADSLVGLAALSVVSCGAYYVAMVAVGLSADERADLKSAADAVRHRVSAA
ncbi:MAG: oligosaccharide flippase family protein [Coriobacteriia bacterium]|nr:oligosaccharide flippase family protein [Coriobacteriia bacterium]